MRIAATLLVLLLSPAAQALNTWGTDMSDLWWNPSESGWGVNVTHQRDVVFATFFVYGADSRVRWYVAPAMTSQTGGNTYVFSGALYETQGPFLGLPTFNPSSVSNRQVGTATLTFPGISTGTLTYTVDGATVSKNIERQTFRRVEIAGNYVGAVTSSITGCGSASNLVTGQFGVTLNPLPSNNITVSATLDNGNRCSYSGTYSQHGRMGAITGTFACAGNTPAAGTFDADEIEVGNNVIVVRYEASYSSCREAGRIAGIKR